MSSFETAVADSKKLTSKPSNDELLELYGTRIPYFSYKITPIFFIQKSGRGNRGRFWRTRRPQADNYVQHFSKSRMARISRRLPRPELST